MASLRYRLVVLLAPIFIMAGSAEIALAGAEEYPYSSLAMATSASSQSVGAWSLFGSSEISNRVLDAFTKWTGMLDRHEKPLPSAQARAPLSQSGQCRSNARFACPKEQWDQFFTSQAGLNRRSIIDNVNLFMNRSPYIIDPLNWGVPDYWATPSEFQRKHGDCEDYAIAKFIALQGLGFDPAQMRIVVLQDENLGIAHAVLAVRFQGDVLILDNQINRVLSHRDIRHYRPIYSINRSAWWLHSGWQ